MADPMFSNSGAVESRQSVWTARDEFVSNKARHLPTDDQRGGDFDHLLRRFGLDTFRIFAAQGSEHCGVANGRGGDRLAITQRHFDLVAGQLVETLRELGVLQQTIDEICSAVAPLASEIVNTAELPPKSGSQRLVGPRPDATFL